MRNSVVVIEGERIKAVGRIGACDDRSLWGSWGEALLEGYRKIRERYGPELASRAYRRALEIAAPGVPWLAPPTQPSPLEPIADTGIETMFERRRAL